MMAKGELDESDDSAGMGFLHDVFAVRFHRSGADVQTVGDLHGGVLLGNQIYLKFATQPRDPVCKLVGSGRVGASTPVLHIVHYSIDIDH